MAGEANRVLKDPITIIESGEELNTGSVNAGTSSVSLDRNKHSGYLYVNCILKLSFSTIPDAGSVIHLYMHEQNILGDKDAPIPNSQYKHKYMGSFVAKPSTDEQHLSLTKIAIDENCTFYIDNVSGKTIAAGWSLTVQPWTWGPWI